MAESQHIAQLVSKVFAIPDVKLAAERKSAIIDFLSTTINGDDLTNDLVISAVTGKKPDGTEKRSVLAYVLTNKRIIKFEIDDANVKSNSYLYSIITGFERKLMDNNRLNVQISTQSDNFGLTYSAANKSISDFFAKAEHSWTSTRG